jgi:DNA uptake protein ComE-like DNA-binding protein
MSLKFSDSETKGATILSIILLFFILTKHFYFDFVQRNNKITFNDTTLQEQFQKFSDTHRRNINTVTEEDLVKLGIYKNVSINIIKYRDQLGGFVALEQLKEVKNIDEQTLKVLEEYTFVDKKFTPRKLKINGDEFKVLLKHPYLEFEDVKNICNYRRFEKIKDVETLKKEKLLKEETIEKIVPYLDFCLKKN